MMKKKLFYLIEKMSVNERERARFVVKMKRMYVIRSLIEQEVNMDVRVCVVDICIVRRKVVYVRSKKVVL